MTDDVYKSNYARCWDEIASDRTQAFRLVDESLTEEGLSEHGRKQAPYFLDGLGVSEQDVVLEIGCGVARLGREIAPHAGRWIGVDVSANMIAIARDRLRDLDNTETHVVSGADLAPIATDSIDKAYCHAVFIHMDKEDWYGYLVEAHRVLRPGGLFYFDVWNLCDRVGWLRWQYERSLYPDRAGRPVHRNQFSTPDEVRAMCRMAGFELLSLVETFSLHTVCTIVPEGADREVFLADLERRTNGAFRGIRYGENDFEFFGGEMMKRLRENGFEPELPRT